MLLVGMAPNAVAADKRVKAVAASTMYEHVQGVPPNSARRHGKTEPTVLERRSDGAPAYLADDKQAARRHCWSITTTTA